ncbi:MAG: NADH-quinone oxidoreductase subunit NuoN [Proteobacteria bacterium]|nr:NADH-quinone oxidoreductase subunit NuoN [Pseudomonadota bacterium]
MTLPTLFLLAPILMLAVSCLLLLMVGAFTNNTRLTGTLTMLAFLLAACPLLTHPGSGMLFAAGGGHLVSLSPFTAMACLLTLALAALTTPLLFPSRITNNESRITSKPESFILLALSVLGMLTLIVASDMLTLYMGLELMSFPLYIMAALARDDAKSSEAGLKYFVLGGFASGLTLYGISLLYAATGTTSFAPLATALAAPAPILTVGLVLTLLGALFKLSMVPFHMWTPDVYEGAPTPITAIMAALPKIAAFALLIRLTMGPFLALAHTWQPALAMLAAISMLAGATMAIVQTNLKRLLAYSTIANVGFIATGVVAANPAGQGGALFYLAVYALTTLGLFAALLATGATQTAHLKGLATRSPLLAALMLILLFSLAGVPPFAGFMAKFGVFLAAIQGGYTNLAIVGVLASVIAAFYSLWLIKLMYFEQPASATALEIPAPLQIVLAVTAALSLILGLLPTLLSTLTLAAATALY